MGNSHSSQHGGGDSESSKPWSIDVEHDGMQGALKRNSTMVAPAGSAFGPQQGEAGAGHVGHGVLIRRRSSFFGHFNGPTGPRQREDVRFPVACSPLADFAGGSYDEQFPPAGDSLRAVVIEGAFGYCMRVNINVVIHSVVNVDVRDHCATLQVEVSAHWVVPVEQADTHAAFYDLYKPDVIFQNCSTGGRRESIFADSAIEFRDLRLTRVHEEDAPSPEGTRRVRAFQVCTEQTVELKQSFHLNIFPFDYQALEIRLRSRPTMIWGRRFDTALCHPERLLLGQSEGNYIVENADLISDYEIEELVCFRVKPSGHKIVDVYSANILIKRNPNSIMWNIVVPCWLVMALSTISFWVDPCNFEGRSSITLTLLLTQAASMQYVHDQLPPVPYLTPVEKQYLVSTGVLFIHGFLQLTTKSMCMSEKSNSIYGIELGINDPDVLDDDDIQLKYTETAKRIDRYGVHLTELVLLLSMLYFLLLFVLRSIFLHELRQRHQETVRQSEAAVKLANEREDQEMTETLRNIYEAAPGHGKQEKQTQAEQLVKGHPEEKEQTPSEAEICKTPRNKRGNKLRTWRSMDGLTGYLIRKIGISNEDMREYIRDDSNSKENEEIEALKRVRSKLYRLLLQRRIGGSKHYKHYNMKKRDTYLGFFTERVHELIVSSKRDPTGATATNKSDKGKFCGDKKTTLMFDCGTGATKAILCTMDQNGDVEVLQPENCEFSASIKDIMKRDTKGPQSSEKQDVNPKTQDQSKEKPETQYQSKEVVFERTLDTVCKGIDADGWSHVDMLAALQSALHQEGIQSVDDLRTALADPAVRQKLICQQCSKLPSQLWSRLDCRLEEVAGLGQLQNTVQWMEGILADIKDHLRTGKEKQKSNELPSSEHVQVVVGMTAWYRKLDSDPSEREVHRAIQVALQTLQKKHPDWIIARLTELDECWYENKAVVHAWERWSGKHSRLSAKRSASSSTGAGKPARTLEPPIDLQPFLDELEAEHAKLSACPSTEADELQQAEYVARGGSSKDKPSDCERAGGMQKAIGPPFVALPDLESQQCIQAMLAVGKGSTQFTMSSRGPASVLELFFIDEDELQPESPLSDKSLNETKPAKKTDTENLVPYMLGMGNQEGAKMLTNDISNWFQGKGDSHKTYENVSRICREWKKQCEMRVRDWRKAQGLGTKKTRPLKDGELLIMISAAWYGLVNTAPILTKGTTGPTRPMLNEQLVRLFNGRVQVELERLRGPCMERSAGDKLEEKIDKMGTLFSNLIYLAVLCNELCSPLTQIRVARDWQLPRRTPKASSDLDRKAHDEDSTVSFRTTWTAGWFLDRYS